jgi:hypothetical protein
MIVREIRLGKTDSKEIATEFLRSEGGAGE